ncbi:MAG: hypothetical protein AAF943_04665 [Pseudomonadota bacterium]
MSAEEAVARDSNADLALALESGQLSDALVKQGKSILKRASEPVRLTVFGAPGTGKSTVMNLLLGADAIPEGVRLPTLSLRYGDTPSAKCVLPDGAQEIMETVDFYDIAKLKPVFVEVALPLAALRKLSMMEVVAGDDLEEQSRAVNWATRRTDIALWCTVTCDKLDERLWASLPPKIQDHAFLLLSKADALGAAGRLATLKESADMMAAPHFRAVVPLATKVAISARRPDGSVDKALMRSSGGVALISAILKEVDVCKRAATEAVDVFLRQIDFDPAAAGAKRAEEQTALKPKTEVKTVILDEAQAQAARALAEKMLDKVEQMPARGAAASAGFGTPESAASAPPGTASVPIEPAQKSVPPQRSELSGVPDAQPLAMHGSIGKMLKKVEQNRAALKTDKSSPLTAVPVETPDADDAKDNPAQWRNTGLRPRLRSVPLPADADLEVKAAAKKILSEPVALIGQPVVEDAATSPAQEIVAEAVPEEETDLPIKTDPAPAAISQTTASETAKTKLGETGEGAAETEATAASLETLTEEARKLCLQVVEQLTAEGEALGQMLESGELDPGTVIDVSVDTVTWAASYLAEMEIADDEVFARTSAKATDAADLVQLIQLETGDRVAEDAISLMIQLKQEIEAELAA